MGRRSHPGPDGRSDSSDCEKSQVTCTVTSAKSSMDFIWKDARDPPYHVFSTRKKRVCIYIVSLAAVFSPLSSNIYFPAMMDIAKDLNVSMSLVSLTVTVYMIVQGIAPSFWGPLSDTRGRRITFIGTLMVYLIANIGLALTKGYTSVMIHRAIQAAGSAATISIGSGVIGDLTTAKERGGFTGAFTGLRQSGQALGPVLGGIIDHYMGFRAIFWFLFILTVVVIVLIIVFLPETLRSIAGNGTVRLHGINKPLIYNFKDQPGVEEEESGVPQPKITIGAIFAPFRFLFEPDVFVTLFYGAVVYTVHSMVTASTTAMLQPKFHLDDLQTGLIFLPNGAGVLCGSFFTGRMMDRDYNRYEARYKAGRGIAPETKLDRKSLDDFPIERARLRQGLWVSALLVLAVSLYGYLLALNHLAAPLILHFVIAFTATSIFTTNSALIIDLYPGAAASATAVNNLVRCLIGALGVAVVQFLLDRFGPGPVYLACGIAIAVSSPLLLVEWRYGAGWRAKRTRRLAARENNCCEGCVTNS